MRWLQVGYLVSDEDVCGIYPSSDRVNLSFAHGSTLKDPEGLLEGTGMGIRHIKVSTVEQVGEETIKAYVREAVASLQRPWRIDRNFALLLRNPDTDGYRQGRRIETKCQRRR
jgi:hypothetical protein